MRIVAAAVALGAAAAVGATYAELISGLDAGTIAVASTLTIDLRAGDGGKITNWDITKMEPDVEPHRDLRFRTLQIHNRGATGAALYYEATGLADKENTCTPPEAKIDPSCEDDSGELSGKLEMSFERRPWQYKQCKHQQYPNGHMWPLMNIVDNEKGGDVFIPASSFVCFEIHFRLPDAPDNNAVQGDSSNFNMKFTLKQNPAPARDQE